MTIWLRPANPPSTRSTRSRDVKRYLDDLLLLRIRFKVDTIMGILLAVWTSHDSLMRCLHVGKAILDSLADTPEFLLAHRYQYAE